LVARLAPSAPLGWRHDRGHAEARRRRPILGAPMSSAVVIVGAGQAGFQVAASLRANGHDGPIRLIGAEPHPPYQRPPLSKGLLLGKMTPDRLLFRQPAFYSAQAIDLDLGRTVAAIDRTRRQVVDTTGRVS